jgi:predicted nucleic acid-binding protein
MDAEAVFVDTNVLVYANRTTSAHHARATERLDALGAAAELFVSRQILREHLAAVTRPNAGVATVPMPLALAEVERVGQLFEVVEDGPAVMGELVRLLARFPTGGRQVYDANIVATMLIYEVGRLLTFNGADFRRFSGLIDLEPL